MGLIKALILIADGTEEMELYDQHLLYGDDDRPRSRRCGVLFFSTAPLPTTPSSAQVSLARQPTFTRTVTTTTTTTQARPLQKGHAESTFCPTPTFRLKMPLQ